MGHRLELETIRVLFVVGVTDGDAIFSVKGDCLNCRARSRARARDVKVFYRLQNC